MPRCSAVSLCGRINNACHLRDIRLKSYSSQLRQAAGECQNRPLIVAVPKQYGILLSHEDQTGRDFCTIISNLQSAGLRNPVDAGRSEHNRVGERACGIQSRLDGSGIVCNAVPDSSEIVLQIQYCVESSNTPTAKND